MRTRAAARFVPLPEVTLDARGFPHIIERFIELAPTATLLAFRGTNKAMRDRADEVLLRHIIPTGEGEKIIVRGPDGGRLPKRRWPLALKEKVRIIDFVNVHQDDVISLPDDYFPGWITSLPNVDTVLWHGTACIGPPVPKCSTFVTSEMPFRLHDADELNLRRGGKLVLLVKNKRVEADLLEFIREYARETFSLVVLFCAPDSRNRRPGDVLRRILERLGRGLADPALALDFTFVNAAAWTGTPIAPDELREQMRAAGDRQVPGGADARLGRVRFLTLEEYADAVGTSQFDLEMQLVERAEEALPEM